MCCNDDPAAIEELLAKLEAEMTVKTARVYTSVPGAELRIGKYGVATNDRPAVVPEDVAAELELDMTGAPEVPEVEADPEKGIVAQPAQPARLAQGPIYRIERDEPTKAEKKAAKAAKAETVTAETKEG